MKVHVMTSGTTSMPERVEETRRIEALKKKFAENIKAMNRSTGVAKPASSR